MMKNNFKNFFLFVIISACFMSSARSAVVVYTDLAAWKAAVYALQGGDIHLDDFELLQTGSLSTGNNVVGGNISSIYISGEPGFNAIDDSYTPDPFLDTLSPNGSTYYLGNVETPTIASSIGLFDLDRSVQAFGADWVLSGKLFMEFGGDTIFFGDYLSTGTGFLGIVSDQSSGLGVEVKANLFGSAFFGMDNAFVGSTVVPLPAAIWLLISGLFVMIGVRRAT